ncbi:MAG: TonB-dependent receptor plug domain-containing protein [Gemmatimonadaceae bacterium]
MKARSFTIAVILAQFAGIPLTAQQQDTVVLAGVVISATKAPVPSSALTQSVTVITGAELRARGVTSVAEALRGVPGVAVAATGSYGALASVFVRGGESRYTKFLVDGVAVNAVGGLFDAAHLSTANVERIEIVRGSSSVVHGADAVSGVVQIFTRQGSGPLRLSTDLRGGSHGTVEAEAGVGGAARGSAFTVHGARNGTDGILPFNNEYLNETASASLGLLRNETTEVSLSARATHAVAHYPTDYVGNVVDSNSFRDQRRLTLSLNGARRLGRGAELRVLGGLNDATDFTDDVTTATGGDTRDRYTSRNIRYRGEGRLSLSAPAGRLTAGAEYQRERERSRSAAGPADGELTPYSRFTGARTTRAVYAEYHASSGRWTGIASGRVDDPSDFSRALTYRVGSALRVAHGLRVHGSVSTSFNAPAFFYLFDTDFTIGNPDLDPERARSVEASVEQSVLNGIMTASATYFDQRFSQLIEYVPGSAPDYVGTYANLTAAGSRGYELEAGTTRWRGLSAHASYTVLRAVVRDLSDSYQGSAQVGDELLRRPRRSGTAGASFAAASGATLSLTGRYVGKRPDFDFRTFPSPRIMLPSFTTMDLAGSLPILVRDGRPLLSLSARVDNALDERYQEVFNFDAPGRRILLGGRIDAALSP